MRNWADIMKRELPADFETMTGPEGPGWVIQLQGYHYFNSPKYMGLEGSNHIRKYMTTNFIDGSVKLPIGTDENGNPIHEEFTYEEMGLSFPLLLDDREAEMETIPNPEWDPEAAQKAIAEAAEAGLADGEQPKFEPPTLQVLKLEFIYQVVWQPQKLSDRLEAKEAARLQAEQEAAQQQDGTAPAEGQPVAVNTP